ncbi:BXL6 [Symbiodinium pilosum]|uniref:BXL6 protein n=1 Tax=Symbiodinium pilosum TaxID=2952 RepID=A0A812WUS3_SYMPI|nr:BXL6 [Symbiodinium pilosum]
MPWLSIHLPLSCLGVILYPEGRDSFELVGHAAFGDVSQKVLLQFMTAICSEGMWDRYFLLQGRGRRSLGTELVEWASLWTDATALALPYLAEGLVFMICWLTKIAYFVLLTDLLVPVAELAAPSLKTSYTPETTRRIVVCIAALFLSPMCFKSSLSALRFMCFASVSSVVVVGAVVGYRAFENLGHEHSIQAA